MKPDSLLGLASSGAEAAAAGDGVGVAEENSNFALCEDSPPGLKLCFSFAEAALEVNHPPAFSSRLRTWCELCLDTRDID